MTAAENQHPGTGTSAEVITSYLSAVSDIAFVVCADVGAWGLLRELDGDMHLAVGLLQRGLVLPGMNTLIRSVQPTTGLLNNPMAIGHREYERLRRSVMDFAQFDWSKAPFEPGMVPERALATLADVQYAYIAVLERLMPRVNDTPQ